MNRGKTVLDDRLVLARQLRKLRHFDIEAGTTVWFMVLDAATWKYSEIYWTLVGDERLSVRVCVVPNKWHESGLGHRGDLELERLADSGIPADLWNADTATPARNDIVILLNPHENLYPAGLVRHWMSLCTTIYIPYTFWLSQLWEDSVFRTRVHRTAARVLYESAEHLAIAKERGRYAAKNGRAIGYPGFAVPSGTPVHPTDANARDEADHSTIVWAPHHSLEDFSTFFAWHEYMLDVAQSTDAYRIVFRPHPVLIPKLVERWGRERLEAYMAAWDSAKSGAVSVGPQESLFGNSTAMIHDSVGFMAEYVATGRPAAYLTEDLTESLHRLNRAGKILLDCHTIVQSESDFVAWTDDVLSGNHRKSDALIIAERDYFAPSRTGVGKRLIAELER
jgi:hypothetical protein